MTFLKVAMHRADSTQLLAWQKEPEIEPPKITLAKTLTARQFQSGMVAYNALHDWHHKTMHPCFPLLLGFEQQVRILADRKLPFSPFGMIHTENKISQMTAIENDDLTIHCQLGHIRSDIRGILTDIEITITQQGQCCLQACSTYLYRLEVNESPDKPYLKANSASPPMAMVGKQMHFKSNAGRQYASISNDVNPIHLYPWTAKLFGYRKPIAHGMHVLARTISTLDRYTAQPRFPLTINNRFLYPASLPCSASVRCSESPADNGQIRFELINAHATKRKQQIVTGNIISTA